jgi:hypothetical protein
MTTLVALLAAAAPFLGIAAIFWLTGAVRERRRRAIARQIELTDEIHRELGAVAAPFVRERARGRWQVRVAVPLESPARVGAVVRIIQAVFTARDGGAAALEIVLTPRPAGRRPALAGPGQAIGHTFGAGAPRMIGAAR